MLDMLLTTLTVAMALMVMRLQRWRRWFLLSSLLLFDCRLLRGRVRYSWWLHMHLKQVEGDTGSVVDSNDAGVVVVIAAKAIVTFSSPLSLSTLIEWLLRLSSMLAMVASSLEAS
ncbi:hypothetical protein RIF29_10112 [Crotalaria pallida]|uniref:Uncharacterized protein n=1 Tax=Crotalaria pallida TaxID=3830 RepID=A0AAN9IKQ2_CROPI